MVRCEFCGKKAVDRVGIFNMWYRTEQPIDDARIRGTLLEKWVPTADRRKVRVYCSKCRKRVDRMLKAIRKY